MPDTALYTPQPHTEAQQGWLNNFIYVLTHAITCALTDPLTGPAAEWAEHHIELSCNRQNGLSFSVNPFLEVAEEDSTLKEWVIAEIIADFASVPATVAISQASPELMDKLRMLIVQNFGDMYEASAEKAADEWAKNNGITVGGSEHTAYKLEHYHKETSLAPGALIWSALSVATNIAIQKYALPYVTHGEYGNDKPIPTLAMSNIFGTAITGLIANGMRLAVPHTINRAENVISTSVEKHVAEPVTRILGSIIGKKHEKLENSQYLAASF